MSTIELLKNVVSAEDAIKQLKKPVEIPREAFTDGVADVALVKAYSVIFDKLIVLGTDILNRTPSQAVDTTGLIEEVDLGGDYYIKFRYSKDEKGAKRMFVGFYQDDKRAKTKRGYSTEFRITGSNNGQSLLAINSDESKLSVTTVNEGSTITTTVSQANFARLRKGSFLEQDTEVNYLDILQTSEFPDTLSEIRLIRNLPPDQEGSAATLSVILYANPENYDGSVIKYSAYYSLFTGAGTPTSVKNRQSNVFLPFDTEQEEDLDNRVAKKQKSLSKRLFKTLDTVAVITTLAENENPILNA
ncbi:hypothetical protein HYT02_03175 [Candidatus Gottesmanbacteria bacterium]|nr:hypothetical protein [Candidatus Gottesmanbacteria bacterium]